jgi:HK97 family phage portal protein
MGWFSRKPKAEERTVTQASSAAEFFSAFGIDASAAGQHVTTRSALGVPAVFAAVNFIAGTIAGLPLHVYRRDGDGRVRVSTPIAGILHDAVGPETTSFEWRKYTFERVLTGGRAFTQILRNVRSVVELRPLNPSQVTVKREDGRRFYEYRQDGGGVLRLPASDVIDIPFMLAEDRCGHHGPIATNRVAIGLAQAVQKRSSTFFDNGGVPPFIVSGAFQSGKAMERASNDIAEAVKRAATEGRQYMTLPEGLTIQTVGSNAEQMQLLEMQRYCVEEVARIYSLPPTFLQDLTHGTYSNTEQQDLHFAKHTLKRWVEQFEQELNLKLFPAGSGMYVEFSVDGLLRGDFKTRMEGYGLAVNSGVMKPNEARRRENLPDDPSGDALMIQGGTVPIGAQNEGLQDEV